MTYRSSKAMTSNEVIENFNAGQNIFRRKSVGVLVDELLHWQQSYRALDTVASEQRTRLEETVRWSALWKQAAKKCYSYALFWEGKRTGKLARAIERIQELGADNDRLGTAGMRARNRIAELEDYKELLKTRLREECNRVLTNAKIAAGLEAENARLRQTLENVRGLLPYWQRVADDAEAHPDGKLIALMHRGAIEAVKMAIEDTTGGEPMSDKKYYCPSCGRTIKAEETYIDKRTGKRAHGVDDGRVSVSHLVEAGAEAGAEGSG